MTTPSPALAVLPIRSFHANHPRDMSHKVVSAVEAVQPSLCEGPTGKRLNFKRTATGTVRIDGHVWLVEHQVRSDGRPMQWEVVRRA